MVVTLETEQQAKLDKQAKYKKKNSSAKRLLSEIISLGGDKTDLDLIRDVLSGSEAEEEEEKVPEASAKNLKIDEKLLEKDLAAFVKLLDIKPPVDSDQDDQEEETQKDLAPVPVELTKKEKKKLRKARLKEALEVEKTAKESAAGVDLTKISDEFLHDIHLEEDLSLVNQDQEDNLPLGKDREEDVRYMVDDILQGIEPTEKPEWANELLFESDSHLWFENSLEEVSASPQAKPSPSLVSAAFARAEALWKADSARYEKRRMQKSKASRDFVSTVLKNGTVTDKVSALTLLIQESPVHNLNYFWHNLVQGMAKKKSRREAILAVDAVKDLLLNNLLPDRKLRYFVDQPCLSKKATDAHLVAWYFEDALKKSYFEFLQTLEELSKDVLGHVKSKVVSSIYELLCAKPEQEDNLLTLLVNKLGDLDRKIASKATHLLCQLLLQHPVMKDVVLGEVERLLLRPNIADRARYYAITFLNQIVLSRTNEDSLTANSLIHLYFTIFAAMVKSMKAETSKKPAPPKKDRTKPKTMQKEVNEAALVEIDSLNSKMMAGLLTGVNRAFPFSKLESEVFDSHMDTLFQISHLATFNTSVQALTLIFQVQTARNNLSDRFYRALYDSLFDRRLHEASKQAMYLNLVYRALKSDESISRIRAFSKRLVQSISIASVPLICGSLFLLSELFNQKPELWGIITDSEIELTDAGSRYDGRKRDPLYANAINACLWEIIPFTHHFHPTVSLYAQTILSGKSLVVAKDATNYDPLLNHTLARFLERFVYKAPKKVKSIHHGNSLMQPRATSNLLVTGGRRKQNAIFEDEENDGALTALDDAPVNVKKWASENDVAADEMFFYKYFKDQKKPGEKDEDVKELSDVESNMEELEEDEIWEAMTRSKGFDKAALEEDDIDDDIDLEMEDLPSDFDDLSDANSTVSSIADGDMSGSDEEGPDLDKNDMEVDRLEAESDRDGQVSDDSQDDLDFADLLEDEELSESEMVAHDSAKPKKSKKRPKQVEKLAGIASKLGYKGEYFDSAMNANEFASAEDFQALIDQLSQSDNDSVSDEHIPKPVSKRKSQKTQESKKKIRRVQ